MCNLCFQNRNAKMRGLSGTLYEWDMLSHSWQPVQAATTPPQGVPAVPGQGSSPAHAPPAAKPFLGMIPKAPLGPGQGPQPVTKVNGTMDPRVIWEDGHVAIIYAKDFPAGKGMGRSKTRKDIKDAVNATIDDTLTTAPGAGSAHDFVKVWLKDLLANPLPTVQPKVVGRLPIDPKQFLPVTPVIAQSGTYKGQIIPDFPHDCEKCGGKYYQGNFSSIHPTEDGLCPVESKARKKK